MCISQKHRRYSISNARVITLALAFSFLCFGQTSSSTPDSIIARLTGTWKENEARRKLGSFVNLRFRRDAKGGIEELRGADARPLVQPVHFEGKPYAIDGSTNTIAWKQIDKSKFERQIFGSGKLIATRRIQISVDGKTLTEETDRPLADGKPSLTTVVFRRTSGDAQGLVGIWKPESLRSTVPLQVKYEAAGAGRLKVSTNQEVEYIVSLDGKPVPVMGATVISGTMVSAKQIDGNRLEMTNSREGVPTGKSITVTSADGKVATVTATNLGPNASAEPSVTVFEKQ